MAEPGPNTSLQHLLTPLDPRSLILSQFSADSEKPNLLQLKTADSEKPNLLQLKTEGFFMERGPRYKAYADLRESKLRMKCLKNPPSPSPQFDLTPPKKQVKFHGSLMGSTLPNKRKVGPSILAQSVPDFSAVLRKENRKPPVSSALPPLMEKSATPPLKSSSKLYGIGAKSGGSKSANAGEKRGGSGLLMARKSCVSVEELKGLSSAAANAINGENRGGGGGRKTVLGYRQFY